MTRLERFILTSQPFTFIRNKSKRVFIPGMYGLPLYDVYVLLTQQLKKVGLNERAAAISFNFIMAIPAATLFLCTLIPYLPFTKQFYIELTRFVQDITPNKQTQRLISNFLDDFFNKPKGGLLSIGLFLALYYSSNAMMGIIRTFDKSLVEKHHSGFFYKRLRAIRLTLILILLLMGTILISLGQGVLFKQIMHWMKIDNATAKFWIKSLRWLVIVALFLYSVAFIYKYAPSVQKRWKLLSPGALLATFLMVTTTALFSYWAQNFSNYNKFYGSIGTLLLLMLLIFINSLMLIIGYELNISLFALKTQTEAKRLVKKQV